jgi:hypothetical protein
MLISRRPEFIFVHNYKTGGTSVQAKLTEKKFGSHAYYADIFRSSSKMRHKDRKLDLRSHFNHFRAFQIREFIGDDFFDRAFKFGFVRNPWDFEVSFYTFIKSYEHTIESRTGMGDFSFRDYIRWRADNNSFVKQWEFFFGEDTKPSGDSLLVDFIGRYENLQVDLDHALSVVGVQGVKLDRLNVSTERNNRDYRSFYDYNTEKIVEEFCKIDIETFGYEFDNPFEPEFDVYGVTKRQQTHYEI